MAHTNQERRFLAYIYIYIYKKIEENVFKIYLFLDLEN